MASLSISDDCIENNDDLILSIDNDDNESSNEPTDDTLSNDILLKEWEFRKQTIIQMIQEYDIFLSNNYGLEGPDEPIKKFVQYKIDMFNKIVNFIDYHYNFLHEKKDEEMTSHFQTIYLLQSYIDIIIEKLYNSNITNLQDSFPLRHALKDNQTGYISDEVWRMCIDYKEDPDDKTRFIASIISIQAIQGICIAEFDPTLIKSKDEITEEDCKIDIKNFRTFFSSHLPTIHEWKSDYKKLYRVAPINSTNSFIADANHRKTRLFNTTLDVQTFIFHGFYDKLNTRRKIGGFEYIFNNKKMGINIMKKTKNICLLDYVENIKLYEKYLSKLDEINDVTLQRLKQVMSTKLLVLALQTNFSVANSHKQRFISKIEELCYKIKEITVEENRLAEKAIADNEALNQLLEKLSLGEKGAHPSDIMNMMPAEPSSSSSSSSSSSQLMDD